MDSSLITVILLGLLALGHATPLILDEHLLSSETKPAPPEEETTALKSTNDTISEDKVKAEPEDVSAAEVLDEEANGDGENQDSSAERASTHSDSQSTTSSQDLAGTEVKDEEASGEEEDQEKAGRVSRHSDSSMSTTASPQSEEEVQESETTTTAFPLLNPEVGSGDPEEEEETTSSSPSSTAVTLLADFDGSGEDETTTTTMETTSSTMVAFTESSSLSDLGSGDETTTTPTAETTTTEEGESGVIMTTTTTEMITTATTEEGESGVVMTMTTTEMTTTTTEETTKETTAVILSPGEDKETFTTTTAAEVLNEFPDEKPKEKDEDEGIIVEKEIVKSGRMPVLESPPEVTVKAEDPVSSMTVKDPQSLVEKPTDMPKGHVTPDWVIIVGFLVGVALLVLVCVAVATRDKWNRPNQFNNTGITVQPADQQRATELETFLYNEQPPKENGKADEYTVIPLDELPHSYSS